MHRLGLILILMAGLRLSAAEIMPPAPAAYFNDYAHIVAPGTAARLNQTLEDFERQSSDQIIVAVFPKMESDSSVEDYTVRVARSWRVGLKDKNNGAVLFVFVQDHKLFIQVGYGLEGVLPDALCQRIIDEQITPRFKAGDFDGGLTAGVQSVIAAARGEYQGTGRTVAEHHPDGGSKWWLVVFLIVGIYVILRVATARSTHYSGVGMSRRSSPGTWPLFIGGFGGGGWGGGSSGGGGFGGGGGFSGGGGSFGGGGAGGSW